MSSIERRIEQAEEALGMGQETIITNIIWFGGEPVPLEERRGNSTIRYVAYESLEERTEGEGRP